MSKREIGIFKRGVSRWLLCVALVSGVHSQVQADEWVAEVGMVHWSYKEPALAVTHEGLIPSVGVSKKFNKQEDASGQWELTAAIAMGRVDYSGTGTMRGQPLIDAQTMLAYLLPTTYSNAQWAPTLAYDHVFNDGRGVTSTGHGGYRRLNQRLSAGLQWRQFNPQGWQWQGDIQTLLRGWQVSELSDIGGEYRLLAAPVNKQRQGWALKLGSCKSLETGQICLQGQRNQVQASNKVIITTLQSRYEVYEPTNNYTRISVTFKRPLRFE